MTKPKACTVCRLPVKGHDGPYGPGKCGVTLSSPPDASDSDADRRRADRARRSLQKLRRESRIKDLAKGLWSEASDGEQATVRDLREDKVLARRVEQTLDEIFGKKKSPASSKKKVRIPSDDDNLSRSSSSSPVAHNSRRPLVTSSSEDRAKARRHSSRHRVYSSSANKAKSDRPTTRSRRKGNRSRRYHATDSDSSSVSSSSPRRSRRRGKGKKSGRNKTINDCVSGFAKVDWPNHHVHFPGKGKKGDGCVTFDELSTPMFTYGYVKNLLEKKRVEGSLKVKLQHLADLMFDAAYYEWEVVRETHAAVLYSMENGTLTWADKDAIDETRERHYRTQAGATRAPPTPRGPTRFPRDHNRARYCEAYQHGNCQRGSEHWDQRWGQVKHVCCMCLLVRHVEIAHPKIDLVEVPVSLHSRVPLAPGENIIELFRAVAQTGVPNYLGARLPVQSSLNIATWRSLLVNCPFPSLPDLLQFGWPINLQPDSYAFPDNVPITNHRSALAYAADVDSFLTKELSYGALCGPFRANPFPFPVFPAPLQTVEKRDCDKRRVVVDLSYPAGRSVNDAIPKDTYLGCQGRLNVCESVADRRGRVGLTRSIAHRLRMLAWVGVGGNRAFVVRMDHLTR
ncbi:hypothetical protein Bbelb_232840 [Branchiostoma belcheri]|nr:hypothetical protein Bbelb_232840 [Branchiostoma belcheri]